MIRHTNFGPTQSILFLSVIMIEASFFGLLMMAIVFAGFKPPGQFATLFTAIYLSPITMRTNEKYFAATRRATKLLYEGSLIAFIHN